MKPTASPVPVWLFDEQQARIAAEQIWICSATPAARDAARRRFHASFRRLV